LINITSPIEAEVVEKLTVGTRVLISGVIYTARDATHRRLVQALDRGDKLPFDLNGQTLYYMGPSPARPNQVIGSAVPLLAVVWIYILHGLLLPESEL